MPYRIPLELDFDVHTLILPDAMSVDAISHWCCLIDLFLAPIENHMRFL